ncbi:16S rRNA (guanine527-N7)-methyltransferase [Micromonospora chersina]|uniref:Ribosomal RNA small subunit methyltransferase G n=2 Tax=Micromonospora chersina TaxID=47854 RepID=A0A1C6VH04_9ACTN|nr:16S rRNA (guanine527-N7)-methyltransferase [Micromonospora chersina]
MTGPGGAPPGPSPVHPDPAVDPVFSAGEVAADPSVPAGPATPADPTFSGESGPEPVVAADPAVEVTPAFLSEPLPAGGTPAPEPAAPGGPVDPVFAEPTAAAGPPSGDRGAAAGQSFMDGADRSAGEQPSPAGATLPPELADAARTLFGDRLDLAAAYAELLATDGVVRGLIGPRETPRLWDRHLLNCAAMAERIPEGASVIDVGSGAGLPGLVLAIARPDLTVTLVEPLARRTSFLIEAVQHLGLTRSVRVFRGRAEEAATGSRDREPLSADIVTARAVAALDRLAAWCLPLAVPGGRLVALKGASAAEEMAEHAAAVARLGGGEPELHRCGADVIDPPATVIEVVRERVVGPARKKGPKRSRGGRRRGSHGRDR